MTRKGKGNAEKPAVEQQETGLEAAQVDAGQVVVGADLAAAGEGTALELAGSAGGDAGTDGAPGRALELLDHEGPGEGEGVTDGKGAQGVLAEGQEPETGAEAHGSGAGDTGTAAEVGGGTTEETRLPAGDLAGLVSSGGTNGSADDADGAGDRDPDATSEAQQTISGDLDEHGSADFDAGNGGGGNVGNDQPSGSDAGAEPGADRGDGSAISGVDGSAGSGDAGGAGGDGLDLRNGGVDGEVTEEDIKRTYIPSSAANTVFVLHLHCKATGIAATPDWIRDLFEEDHHHIGDLVDFIRRLGRDRATPGVVIEQCKITGRRGAGEIVPIELVMMKTFITTLLDLDDFYRDEAARQAPAPAPQPHKVPIEDTTLELVDDTFDTV